MKFENAKKYRRDVTRLYRTAFPREERAPLALLFRRTKRENFDFYAVTEQGAFIGLAYVIRKGRQAYVFYLAVREDLRGQGYGGRILEALKEMLPDYILTLGIEDPHDETAENLPERIRRLGFYERHGFRLLHIRTKEAGVVYELMGTDSSIRKEEYLLLIKEFTGERVFRLVFSREDVEVLIPPRR